MDNDNYKLYTKDVLNLIFSNQDIDQLIPYLSKMLKPWDYIQKIS